MRRFIFFLMVGGANTVLGLTIMFLLNAATHNPYFANVVAYVIGFFSSFWAHDVFTFKDIKEKKRWRIVPYTGVYAVSFLANYIVLGFALHFTKWPEPVVFVVTSAVFSITSYSLNAVFVYSNRKKMIEYKA